jgi:outer membrane protein insertion porin family
LFPTPFIEDQRSVQTSLFFDFGNVFDAHCSEGQLQCTNFDAKELRMSAGLALTWISGFGPLSFSVAKVLDYGPQDEREVFQFTMGQTF